MRWPGRPMLAEGSTYSGTQETDTMRVQPVTFWLLPSLGRVRKKDAFGDTKDALWSQRPWLGLVMALLWPWRARQHYGTAVPYQVATRHQDSNNPCKKFR